MNVSEILQLKALKYPRRAHYDWEGEVLEKTDEYVLVYCKAGRKLVHHTKDSVFTMQTSSIEYFSLTEWYTAAVEIDNNEIIAYYCNVAQPSVLAGNELSFVDLDLDLIKKGNSEWYVVDEDEFEENSRIFNYPADLKVEAINALERLKLKALSGQFPFNKDILEILQYT